MKSSRNIAATLLRNCKALMLRLLRAVRHRDAEEFLDVAALVAEEGVWAACLLLCAICFIAGFFRPWCFITAIVYLLVSGIIRADLADRKSDTV